MSPKFFALAALLLLPVLSNAQEKERDMHVFQMCPSSSYEACSRYQKVLQAHVGKPDFDSVRLEYQEQLVRDEAARAGRDIDPKKVMRERQYADILVEMGIEASDARTIAHNRFVKMAENDQESLLSHIRVLRINGPLQESKKERREISKEADRLQAMIDKGELKYKSPESDQDALLLKREGLSNASDNMIAERARRLRIYARSNLVGVSETEKHQMLQRAQRLQRISEGRVATSDSSSSVGSKSLK